MRASLQVRGVVSWDCRSVLRVKLRGPTSSLTQLISVSKADTLRGVYIPSESISIPVAGKLGQESLKLLESSTLLRKQRRGVLRDYSNSQHEIMTLERSATLVKSGEEYYGLNRDENETKRLSLQHSIISKSLGFLVHPNIPVNRPDMRIADFGAGTGIWLLEVSKIVPASCELVGFDISSTQFPLPSKLPKNVSFHAHDILKPLPQSCHGAFDIIAVKFLVTVLAGDGWDRAVSNLVPLLKPGGWLQWIDPDVTTRGWTVMQTQVGGRKRMLSQGITAVNRWASFLGKTLDGCKRLPNAYLANGLECLQHDIISSDNDPSMRREFTIQLSTAWQPTLVKLANMEGSGITVEEAVALGKNMVEEAEKGEAYTRWETHIIVGRKPKGSCTL